MIGIAVRTESYVSHEPKHCGGSCIVLGQSIEIYQVWRDARTIQNAQTARHAGITKPIHDANIGTAKPSICTDMP